MKRFVLIVSFIALTIVSYSQTTSGYGSILKGKSIDNRKPIPFKGIREADVIWSKILWREVNLGEKINLPLYFPKYPMDGRYSLIDLLLKGIREETILAFDTDDDEFKVPINVNNIYARFGGRVENINVEQADGSMKSVADTIRANTSEVKKLLIKEFWYFDKQSSTMQVRIMGLCPVRVYKKNESDEELQMKLFWVNYDECRNLLVKYEVYNNQNDGFRFSFDDLFVRRHFSSIIKKESNVYNNRPISSYASGIDAMLESDRVKTEMFNWEQDLWSY